MFCKMCDVRIYMPGDIIDLQSGGILFRGGLTKLKYEESRIKEMTRAETIY